MSRNWRCYVQWMADRPRLLRLAAKLGRSRGRLRLLDRLSRPPAADCKPDLSDWTGHDLAAVWIGHATVLLRIGGLNVLTDPVFSNKIGLGLGLMTLGSRRLVAPALTIADLPPIDLVLISHAHFDHLDRPTLHRLPKSTTVLTSDHNADLIADLRFDKVVELKWGQSHGVGDVRVTALPAKHWGARTLTDRHRGYNAFMLEANRTRVLFAGDTAYHEHFRGIGPVDVMIVGIGAYDPWIQNHANPEQVWQMARHAQARHVIPVHHRTFRQSREPLSEPMQRLLAAAGDEADRIVIRQIGGQWAM